MTTEKTASPAPAYTSPAPENDPDDSDYGWAMFVAFITAVLAITFAVGALALVQTWWMLGVVFGVDLLITALVFRLVMGALADPASSGPERSSGAHEAPSTEPVVVLAAHALRPAH